MIIVGLLAGLISWSGCQETSHTETTGVESAQWNVKPATPLKVGKATVESTQASSNELDPMPLERPLRTGTFNDETTQSGPSPLQIHTPAGASKPVSPKAGKPPKRPKIRPGPGNRKKTTMKRQKSNANPVAATAPVARVNAELLLRPSDIDSILGIKKGLDVHALSGIQGSTEYDGIYWARKKGSAYVAGVQVWRPHSPIEAQRQYNDMVRSYPNVQESNAITNKTFLAHWNDFIYLAYMVPGKRTVVSLTCHVKACKSPSMLVRLGERIKGRL